MERGPRRRRFALVSPADSAIPVILVCPTTLGSLLGERWSEIEDRSTLFLLSCDCPAWSVCDARAATDVVAITVPVAITVLDSGARDPRADFASGNANGTRRYAGAVKPRGLAA